MWISSEVCVFCSYCWFLCSCREVVVWWEVGNECILTCTCFHTGKGVFERSIAALLKLNKAGYGSPEHPELALDLVYNPGEFNVSKIFV